MSFDPTKPYNELPLLPPRTNVETHAVLKAAIGASRALGELKGLGETLPNQALLVNSIVLQEAKASSEIENIVTTNDALFRAFTAATRQIDPASGCGRHVHDGHMFRQRVHKNRFRGRVL